MQRMCVCGLCGVNTHNYVHNRKTRSVDIHLDNSLTGLELLRWSTDLLYSSNQEIHPISTKGLPLHHILNHLNTVYILTANSVRHQQRDSCWAVLRAIMELHFT